MGKTKIIRLSILLAYIALNITLTIVLNLSILELFVSVAAVLYVFLLAEKSMLNFAVGFVSLTAYAFVAYQSRLYGEMIYYLAIDAPLSVAALFYWKKCAKKARAEGEQKTVKSRSLSKLNYVLIICSIALASLVYSMVLGAMGGQHSTIDAVSTCVTLAATLLALFCFKEQWGMWVISYLISTLLWIVAGNVLMVIMSIGCLANCVYGYIVWNADAKKAKQQASQAPETGEMVERSKALAWKAGELLQVPGVRIPLSPPKGRLLSVLKLQTFSQNAICASRERRDSATRILQDSSMELVPDH